ncbi:hypothetical protein ACLKA7_013479 [Drosophila subpalustris]
MNVLHPKIRNLLLHRFLYATCKCYHMEYQLLFLFLLYMRFDVAHPINCLRDVVYWSIFSLYTWRCLLVLMLTAAAYGMLLCHMHQRMPICRSTWQVFRTQELPLKFCLLTVLINLSYCNSCTYVSYLSKMDVNLDESLTSHYLVVSGVVCGLFHFLVEHCLRDCEIWPLPVVRQPETPFQKYWLRWPNIRLGLQKSVIPMLLLAVFYWPSWQLLGQACWQLLGQVCCLSILITAKLNDVKSIYGTLMLRKLPLTLRTETEHQELKLPLIVALSTTSLHGFQLQVAKDFYDDMANTLNGECRHLFKLYELEHRHTNNWDIVRDLLLGRIKYFMDQLKNCLAINKYPTVVKKPAKDHSKMRPLKRCPPKPKRFFSCRRQDLSNHPVCQPLTAIPESSLCLSNQLCRLDFIRQNKLLKWTSQKNLEYELSCGLSFIWLIQGLVCICLRSLKEDKHGILQADLSQIFQLLLDMERLLCSAEEFQEVPSVDLAQLLQATSRSINKLIFYFKPYLECIIEDEKLLKELQRRK